MAEEMCSYISERGFAGRVAKIPLLDDLLPVCVHAAGCRWSLFAIAFEHAEDTPRVHAGDW